MEGENEVQNLIAHVSIHTHTHIHTGSNLECTVRTALGLRQAVAELSSGDTCIRNSSALEELIKIMKMQIINISKTKKAQI